MNGSTYPIPTDEMLAKIPRRFVAQSAGWGLTTEKEVAEEFKQKGFHTQVYLRDSVTALHEWEVRLRVLPREEPNPRSVLADVD